MRDGLRAEDLDAFIAVRATVEVVEEALAPAEQDGDDHQVHVVDQAGAQVVLDRGSATADPDVAAAGGIEGPSSAASMPS